MIKRHILSKLIENDWNYDCLTWYEELYNDFTYYMTWDKWIIFGMYSWLAWYFYRCCKARKQWKKELADEGEDWREYDTFLCAWRELWEVLGWNFLIKSFSSSN